VYNSLVTIDTNYKLSMQPVSGLYLDIHRDEVVAKASADHIEK
jgi:hypothetical protein